MAAEWHYSKDGQRHGPVSAAELKALARAGKLVPTDMVWKAGMAEWRVASGVKGLFPAPTSDSPPPAPPASHEPVSSAPVGDSFSFMDKVKGRLGKATAKSFIRKNRLWIGIGTSVVACIILVLFLLPAGTLPGGKKGYTQRILDLDPKVQQECKVKIPKGAKPLHPPGSVADFVQSITLFNGGARCLDVKNGGSDLNQHYGYLGEFMVEWTNAIPMSNAVPIPRKVWEGVYGAPQNLTTKQEGIGYNRKIMVDVDHWTIECTDEKLNARGACVDKTLVGTIKGIVVLQFVHFSKRRVEFCPKAPEILRDIRFEYK